MAINTRLRATARIMAPALIGTMLTVLASVTVAPAAYADGGCFPNDAAGKVARHTRQLDTACVSPAEAQKVRAENDASARGEGHTPGGPFGGRGCVPGLVWREGFDGDTVCVTPARRSEMFRQNAGIGAGSTGGMKAGDAALLNAINDARLHPEKYPPHGNAANAKMTACPKALGESWALDNTAVTHNSYLAPQPASVLSSGLNAHRNPPPGGVLTWAPEPNDPRHGPIEQAGYDRLRGEIVAWGQSSADQAVRFWMQDDAPSQWGHRNNILNCGYTDVGAAHLAGGTFGHYWTADLGAH